MAVYLITAHLIYSFSNHPTPSPPPTTVTPPPPPLLKVHIEDSIEAIHCDMVSDNDYVQISTLCEITGTALVLSFLYTLSILCYYDWNNY